MFHRSQDSFCRIEPIIMISFRDPRVHTVVQCGASLFQRTEIVTFIYPLLLLEALFNLSQTLVNHLPSPHFKLPCFTTALSNTCDSIHTQRKKSVQKDKST